MSKVIAIIASLDTKDNEVLFLVKTIHSFGYKVFIIDIGAGKSPLVSSDVDTCNIASELGYNWVSPMDVEKRVMIDVLKSGISRLVAKLHSKGLFDGIISIGGLQNTTVAVKAMQELPLGFPKVMVSTVASGKRPFETIVGFSDIVTIPSIADFSGNNVITDTILVNAAAAVYGMIERAGRPVSFPEGLLIGITTMGVVDKGVSRVVKGLKNRNFQVASFHSTGVGGAMMDKFVAKGLIKATVEFSLHEIIGELFGGYSAGSVNRLCYSSEKGIPQLVVPGACDFIDLNTADVSEGMLTRKHIFHNSDLVHIKLLKEEIQKVGELVAKRLNKSKGPVTIVVPLDGFRSGAKKGEPLFDPEIDFAFVRTLKSRIDSRIKFVEVEANINDENFGNVVLEEIKGLLS